MIEKMSKIVFAGPAAEKEQFIRELQNLGIVQIEPWKGEIPSKKESVDTSKSERILTAWKTLDRLEKDKSICFLNRNENEVQQSADEVVENIFKLETEINSLKEKRQLIQNKVESIRDWGYFDLKQIKEIEKRGKFFIQFWDLQVKFEHLVDFSEVIEVIEINRDALRRYFMTFSEKPVHLKHCLEIHFDITLEEAENQLKANIEEEKKLKCQLLDYINCKNLIFRRYLEELNRINYKEAVLSSAALAEGMIFAIQGWIPEKEYPKLKEKIVDYPVFIDVVEPDENDRIPTFIRNKGVAEMGQDLIGIYDTPSHKDWDPSAWIFFSFAVFFAMIFGDGGYALCMLVGLFYFKRKLKKPKKSTLRFFNMAIIISAVTAFYGLISGSFFGLSQENQLFGWLINMRLFDGGDIGMMMQVSVIIGMVHICLSLILKGLRSFIDEKDWQTALTNIAWIVMIWAFYFWYKFNGIRELQYYADLSLYLLGGGAGAVFLLAGRTWNPIIAVLRGLLAVYNGVQFFADVLSYIRIFALGLSGALIAQSFNGMAEQVWNTGTIGMIFAPVIFIFGHTLNFVLCIMGGVIHGLRLNFLEWYRWNFDGNGRIFKPLKNMLSEE